STNATSCACASSRASSPTGAPGAPRTSRPSSGSIRARSGPGEAPPRGPSPTLIGFRGPRPNDGSSLLTFAPRPVRAPVPDALPARAVEPAVVPARAPHRLAALSVRPREVRRLSAEVGAQDAYEDEADQVATEV